MWTVEFKLMDKGMIVGFGLRDRVGNLILVRKAEIGKYTNQIVSHKFSSDLKLLGDEVSEYEKKNIKVLYHCSKNGISGRIRPSSRANCDFGSGFYLGESIQQVSGMAANYRSTAKGYIFVVNTTDIKVFDFRNRYDLWALYVGYKRGLLTFRIPHRLLMEFKKIDSFDAVYGLIADDKMAMAFSSFCRNSLTIDGLIYCLKYVKLGSQFVLKTDKACNSILGSSAVKLSGVAACSFNFADMLRTAQSSFRHGLMVSDIGERWK